MEGNRALLDHVLSPAMIRAAITRYHRLMVAMHQQRRCQHCHETYSLWHDMGRRPCRGHPGLYFGRQDEWTCCGASRHARRDGAIDGCSAVDHVDDAFHHEAHVHEPHRNSCLPLLVFLLLPHQQERLVHAVHHRDTLPTLYASLRYDMLEEGEGEDEEEAEEREGDWGDTRHGAATIVAPMHRKRRMPQYGGGGEDEDDPYDETRFTIQLTLQAQSPHEVEVRLDDYFVIIRHA